MQAERLLGARVGDVRIDPALAGALREPEEIEGDVHLGAPRLGVGLVALAEGQHAEVDQLRVSTVHLHCTPDSEHSAYTGLLPRGLGAEMSRHEVRNLLGDPERSGETVRLPVLGDMPAWDRFVVGGWFLHVQYRGDGSGLSLVTMMTPEAAPR